MAERMVSMHATHRSGKEVIDGFLSRPTARVERPAIVWVQGDPALDEWLKKVLG